MIIFPWIYGKLESLKNDNVNQNWIKYKKKILSESLMLDKNKFCESFFSQDAYTWNIIKFHTRLYMKFVIFVYIIMQL